MVRFFQLFFLFSRFNRFFDFFYSILVISGKKDAKIIFFEFFFLNVSFFKFQTNHSYPNLCVNDNLLFSYHVFLISKPIGEGFDGRG